MLQLAAARQKVKSHASLAAPIMLALMASVVLLLGANASVLQWLCRGSIERRVGGFVKQRQ